MAIWAFNFWILVSGTSAADGVEWKELEAVLVPRIDSIRVVLVGSDVD